MRWKPMVFGLLLAYVGLTGCKQHIFLTEADYDHYQSLLPESVEFTVAPLQPDSVAIPAPTTVLDPERSVRYISLNEAIAVALEQGIGTGRVLSPRADTDVDIPLSFNGQSVSGSDAVRILALQPALAATNIESSLSKFDARWLTTMSWNNVDRPVGTPLDTFQALGVGTGTIQENNASFTTGMVKPLPTGGVAGITFRTDYLLSNLNQRVNPSYQPSVTFGFEQPLLQGYGVEINQLRASHPGSTLFQFQNQSRTDGILITRLQFDMQRVDFEYGVSTMLLNVETAYWNLYGAYWVLYSREQALRQAYEAWRINKARFEAGRIPIQDFAQSRGQYELFRGQRITALGDVLERERQLRGLLSLPVEDGMRLVPVDSPTVAPFQPDWQLALTDAVSLFPSLLLARQDLKLNQLNLITQKNLLLPDLRFFSTYDYNSIGTRLDGTNGLNAFRNLSNSDFNNWSLGLRAEIPLGFRDAHSAVRQARLRLAQSYIQLRDQELRVQRNLARWYRLVYELHERMQATHAQRMAFADQLGARFKEFLAGRGTLDFLLESQRNWADALAQEYQNIVEYNKALANFEYVKGTLLSYDNVIVSEGALPEAAQVRAVEHQQQRLRALPLREHAVPDEYPTLPTGEVEVNPNLPPLPGDIAALPPLSKLSAPPLHEVVRSRPVPVIREPLPTEAKNFLQRALQKNRPAPAATEQPGTAPSIISLSKPAGAEGGPLTLPPEMDTAAPVISLSKPAGAAPLSGVIQASKPAGTSSGFGVVPASARSTGETSAVIQASKSTGSSGVTWTAPAARTAAPSNDSGPVIQLSKPAGTGSGWVPANKAAATGPAEQMPASLSGPVLEPEKATTEPLDDLIRMPAYRP